MLHKVQQYILENNLPQSPARLVVGVSGGADSVALLQVLLALGYDCVLAHCNFSLRGSESDRDEAFVAALAKTYSLPYYNIVFDTKAYAREKSISIEMAARDLRYAWFEQLRVEQYAAAIAVAHHANDVVETFLMNMVRGTGIRGLTGIKPQQGKIVRPFLGVARTEIETYLQEQNLAYVTDSSNLELDYTRNKYRNSIIPQLEELNPSLRNTILQEIKILNEVYTLYNVKIEELKASSMQECAEGIALDIPQLKQQPALSSVLYECLCVYGFGADMMPQVLNLIDAPTGKQLFSNTHLLLKDRNRLLLSSLKSDSPEEVYYIYPDTLSLEFPFPLQMEELSVEGLAIDKSSTHAYLDFEKLQFPLKLRKWQAGDSFVPFGMKGRKKVSDFLIDAKISSLQKQSVWVLDSGNEIVWLMGFRLAANYAVSSYTSKVLHLMLS